MAEATALDELENQVNDVINRMRRAVEDRQSGDDSARVENHPKFKELSKRLRVAVDHFHGVMGGDDERAPGDSGPAAPPAQTPEDVLSSPYPGEEPRYAAVHDGHPDPIERAKPSPPAQAAGRVAEDEPEADKLPELRDAKRDAKARK